MNKSRSIKGFKLEGSLRFLPKGHELARQPGKPPPCPSTPNTTIPQKPSPNYMKSTRSFLAKKEQTKVSISSSFKLRRVAKSLSRSSSLKKRKSLTKIPSFKHTRTGGNKWSKVVLYDNLDAQKATCSSTQKDSKFPICLKLNPGATEAQGTSALKVCRYDHCSLNGHHHKEATPLKRFLTSRRRVWETQRAVKRKATSPCKAKAIKKNEEKDDFFIKIYVPKREVVEVNEVGQSEDIKPLNMNFRPDQASQDEDRKPKQEVEKSNCVSLEEFFGERLDLEWEEGQISAVHFDNEGKISSQGDKGDDQDVSDLKTDKNVSSNLEDYVAEKLLTHYHEEIAEWQHLNDASSIADCYSTQPVEEQIEELIKAVYINSSPEDDENICYSIIELKSINQRGVFSNSMDEIREAGSEDLDSYKYPDEYLGDKANQDEHTGAEFGEENNAGIVMGKILSAEDSFSEIKYEQLITSMKETAQDVNNNQAGFDKIESENDADESVNISAELQQANDGNSSLAKDASNDRINANKFVIQTWRNSEEQDYSNVVKLHSNENCIVALKEPELEESHKTEELYAFPVIGNETSQNKNDFYSRKVTDPNPELANVSNKLKSWTRCKKTDKGSEEVIREFNPRGPNFLPIKPDPEAEKVDLRHQELDERRNAEEWMLDYALQKTVNQLASAQKKKVALLVDAFESVIPIPELKPHKERNSPDYSHVRPIHACS